MMGERAMGLPLGYAWVLGIHWQPGSRAPAHVQ